MVTGGRRYIALPGLTEGKAVSFNYHDAYGLENDGFAFRWHGRIYAYKNQCRHQPLSLDFGDNEFFTEENTHLLCRNHGALFEPDTGQCVAGPCLGARLIGIEVGEDADGIYIILPSNKDVVDLE